MGNVPFWLILHAKTTKMVDFPRKSVLQKTLFAASEVRNCVFAYLLPACLLIVESQAYIKKEHTPGQVFPVPNVYTNSFVFLM